MKNLLPLYDVNYDQIAKKDRAFFSLSGRIEKKTIEAPFEESPYLHNYFWTDLSMKIGSPTASYS
jgi:hypothetical protein